MGAHKTSKEWTRQSHQTQDQDYYQGSGKSRTAREDHKREHRSRERWSPERSRKERGRSSERQQSQEPSRRETERYRESRSSEQRYSRRDKDWDREEERRREDRRYQKDRHRRSQTRYEERPWERERDRHYSQEGYKERHTDRQKQDRASSEEDLGHRRESYEDYPDKQLPRGEGRQLRRADELRKRGASPSSNPPARDLQRHRPQSESLHREQSVEDRPLSRSPSKRDRGHSSKRPAGKAAALPPSLSHIGREDDQQDVKGPSAKDSLSADAVAFPEGKLTLSLKGKGAPSVALQSLAVPEEYEEEDDDDYSAGQLAKHQRIVSKNKPSQAPAATQKPHRPLAPVSEVEQGLGLPPSTREIRNPGPLGKAAHESAAQEQESASDLVNGEAVASGFPAGKFEPKAADVTLASLTSVMADPEAMVQLGHNLLSEAQQSAPEKATLPGLSIYGEKDEEMLLPTAIPLSQVAALQQSNEGLLTEAVLSDAEKHMETEGAMALESQIPEDDSSPAADGSALHTNRAAAATIAPETGLESSSPALGEVGRASAPLTSEPLGEVANLTIPEWMESSAGKDQDRVVSIKEAAAPPEIEPVHDKESNEGPIIPSEAVAVERLTVAGKVEAAEPSRRATASSASLKARSAGGETSDSQHAVQNKERPHSDRDSLPLARKQRHSINAGEPKSPFQKGRKLAGADEEVEAVAPTLAARPRAHSYHDDFNSDPELDKSPVASGQISNLPIAKASNPEVAPPVETVSGTEERPRPRLASRTKKTQVAKKKAQNWEIVAATSSDLDPSESLPDSNQNSNGPLGDHQASAKQPAKPRGRGRPQPRGRAARGASSRGASTKATAGRGRPPPCGPSTGRASPRGRGRGRKATAQPVEEGLQEAVEISEALPPPEPVQAPPQPAVMVLPKKRKQPTFEDEIAKEASIMEVAAPVAKPKAKKARNQPAKRANISGKEQSADPASRVDNATITTTEDQAAAPDSTSPELSAEAGQGLESPAPATDTGDQQNAAAHGPEAVLQPGEAVQNPLQQPDSITLAVAMQQPEADTTAVETEHFVRRSSRNHKPIADILPDDQPVPDSMEDSGVLGRLAPIQPPVPAAQQEVIKTPALGPEISGASGRPLKSTQDLHEQPDTIILAAPASKLTPSPQPEASRSSKPRGRGRGRGRGGGRTKKPKAGGRYSEEASQPIAEGRHAAQTAAEVLPAEPEAVLAQAEEVQPPPATETAEPASVLKEPELPVELETQPAVAIPKQPAKKMPKPAAKKKGKAAAASKRKAAELATTAGPIQAAIPSASNADGPSVAVRDSGPRKHSKQATEQSSQIFQEVMAELQDSGDGSAMEQFFQLLKQQTEPNGDESDVPLEDLFGKPEGETGLSLQDMKAILKASPSEMTFPDSFEWKPEAVQSEFRAVTQDIQELFLQVKEAKQAAESEEKTAADSLQKVDEDMALKVEELKAKEAAEQRKLDEIAAEQKVMEAEQAEEEAELDRQMATLKARHLAVLAQKKAAMERMGLVEVPASELLSNADDHNIHNLVNDNLENLALPSSTPGQLAITAD